MELTSQIEPEQCPFHCPECARCYAEYTERVEDATSAWEQLYRAFLLTRAFVWGYSKGRISNPALAHKGLEADDLNRVAQQLRLRVDRSSTHNFWRAPRHGLGTNIWAFVAAIGEPQPGHSCGIIIFCSCVNFNFVQHVLCFSAEPNNPRLQQ